MAARGETIKTDIPARLDRLPWSRWHWLVVLALGTVWILDGLEVTIVGAISGVLQKHETLALSSTQVGLAGAVYIGGAVSGALLFGYLTDRLGRKKLFQVTLALYLLATIATAFSWSPLSFFVFRFCTGLGIGGEYSAINSAIDELIPARVRGWVDLAVNGSWWFGTAAGAALSLVLLDPKIFAVDLGWRLAFGLGAVVGFGILLTRRYLPESPRWLMIHGRIDEAEQIVAEIERGVQKSTGQQLVDPDWELEIEPREATGFGAIARTMLTRYKGRTVLGLTLMSAQAFAYNAIFFTYAIVLTTFYDVKADHVGYYLIPFAVGNFLGPLLLGRLFDVVGRRVMITVSYGAAAAVLMVAAILFQSGSLTATSLTLLWCVSFFFLSAGASAGYLTVSEIFPLEIRAMAIAFFYAVATAIGGISGPLLFGRLIETKHETPVMIGFLIGAGWLVLGAVAEAFLGVEAAQKPLEKVAEPLSAEQAGEDIAEPVEPERPYRRHERALGSPRPTFAGRTSWEDTSIRGEVDALAAAASGDGPLSERELIRRAGGRYWGPGRGRRAVRRALADGRIVRRGRGYVAGEREGASG